MKKLIISLLIIALVGSSSAFAKETVEDPLTQFIAGMFEINSGITLCQGEGDSMENNKVLLVTQLQANGISNSATKTQLAYAVWSIFPCPFRPSTNYIRKANAEDIKGVWVYPKSSQQLRFGPKSPQKSLTHPLATECEIIGYYDKGELRSALIAGEKGCIIKSEHDFKAARKKPLVTQWALIADGRLKVTRSDVDDHIEEWDILIVEKEFVEKGVTFEVGDLISYLRKEKNNQDYNASTQFRHLLKLPKK